MAARGLLAALVLLLAVDTGLAESYEFENLPVPESKVLQALYRFYVYTGKDVPDDLSGQPYVEFNGLSVKVPDDVQIPENYNGFQVSIMPYQDFWTLIDPKKFCATAEDVRIGRAKNVDTLMVQSGTEKDLSKLGVYMHTVPAFKASSSSVNIPSARFNLNRTDVYALVVSNCGEFEKATMAGEVTVMNVFGYLPGDQYYKMAFYGLQSIFYLVLSGLWLMLAMHWWKGGEKLHHLHYCITFVLALGVIESVFSWYFLYDWNFTSERPEILFLVNIAVSVSKPIFSYILVLITGLGWGVTRPDLELGTMRKVQVMVFFYCVAHIMWEFLAFFRHSYDISGKVLAAVFVPGLMVNTCIFCWMLGALRKMSEELDGESRALFKRIRAIMILGVFAAVPATALQLLELTGTLGEDLLPSRTSFKWHYQWFLFDAMGQIIYGVVFVMVMCQWAPQNKTEQYLYSEQVNQDEDAEEPDKMSKVAAAEPPDDAFAIGGEEEEDLEVTAGGKSGNVKAETIGARGD
jgi:hypothetical protein